MKKLVLFFVLFFSLFYFSGCKKEDENKNSSFNYDNLTPKSLELVGNFQNVYSIGEDFDYSNLILRVSYETSDLEKTLTRDFSLFSDDVALVGFNTLEEGHFVGNIKFSDLTLELPYDVYSYTLTISLLDGTIDGKTSFSLPVYKNKVSLIDPSTNKSYEPIPNDETKEFAGWYYDENLENRVSLENDSLIDIYDNLTIYASYDTAYPYFSYEINDDSITLLSYDVLEDFDSFMEPDFYIPKTIKNYPVTKIGDDFLNSIDNLYYMGFRENLIFPEDSKVKEIGDNAFKNCSFKTINFPNSIEKIGDFAVYSNPILNLTLPKKLRILGESAFAYNTMLESIDFNQSDLVIIGNNAFEFCVRLKNIDMSNNVEFIGSYAFKDNSGLEEINLSSALMTIGVNVFSGTPEIKNINIDNNFFKSIDGNLYSADGENFYRYCYGKDEVSFTLPSSVKIIFESAFDASNDESELDEIILNDGLKEISNFAFRNSKAKFKIPKTVTTIGQMAFINWQGSEFLIDSENEKFSVIDGILVTKDLKKLLAIPANYSSDTLSLPDSIEEIRGYAISYNNTIKNIIIGPNSKLNYLYDYSILINTMKELVAITINKEEPFNLSEKAFYSYDETSCFIILCNKSYIDNYSLLFSDYYLSSDVCLNSIILSPEEYALKLINQFSNTLPVTSFNAFKL